MTFSLNLWVQDTQNIDGDEFSLLHTIGAQIAEEHPGLDVRFEVVDEDEPFGDYEDEDDEDEDVVLRDGWLSTDGSVHETAQEARDRNIEVAARKFEDEPIYSEGERIAEQIDRGVIKS